MQNPKSPAVPLWKSLVVIATMLAAAIFMLAINAYIGGALFIIGVFLQTYGGFSSAQAVEGETPGWIAGFAFGWVLLIGLSVAMQSVVPEFTEVFKSFGADLPLPTLFTMQAFPALLVLPYLVALAWNFWPRKTARLRAATAFCWLGVGAIFLMVGTLYLPIFKLGSVV